jgi:hypothetical protein
MINPEEYDGEKRRKRNIDRADQEYLDKYLETKTSSALDSGNKLRLIVPSMIGEGTIMMRIYKAMFEYMSEQGTATWINRTLVTHALVRDGIGHEQAVKGHLSQIYQKKYSMDGVTSTTTGLLMKKVGDMVKIRLN